MTKYPYDGDDSLYSPDFTYQTDHLTCIKSAFAAHLIFSYLLTFTGLVAMISRVIPKIRWMHPWFGKTYIVLMIWTIASSLLIHNEGIPPAVIGSFIWVLGGLTVAWFVI